MDQVLLEIRQNLAELAKSVESESGPDLESWLERGIMSCTSRLKQYIPGLDPVEAAELDNADLTMEMIDIHLMSDSYRAALRLALENLSILPHHSRLWYRAAESMMWLHALPGAFDALGHSLWINPGQDDAALDLRLWTQLSEGRDPYGPLP